MASTGPGSDSVPDAAPDTLYWRTVAFVSEPSGRLQIEIRRDVRGKFYFEATHHNELVARGDPWPFPTDAQNDAQRWYNRRVKGE